MKLTIIGASGHGKVVADIAERCGYTEISFLDDNLELRSCGSYSVVGATSLAKDLPNDLFVAIGNNAIRARILEELFHAGRSVATLVHPNAVLAKDVEIGAGTVIMAGVVINPNVHIGHGCIVNTCSSIDHDCRIGNYVHIAVGAHLCGTVTIDSHVMIGAGATIINNISINKECMVGAGAVVVNTLSTPGTYVGVPAKIIKARARSKH